MEINNFLKILVLVSVFAVGSQMLIGNNYAQAATVKAEDASGHMKCKDQSDKLKIEGVEIDAKTNEEDKWGGTFSISQGSQGADWKIDDGKLTTSDYEFKTTAEDTTGNCNDEKGTKGTLKGSCGDDVSIKFESELGTTYDATGKVTCSQ